ncbi:MAG: hypothetical protein ACXWLR_07190 [Myxococcales bacterium]
MAHVTTSWKRLPIVIVIGLAAVLASRIGASHHAPASPEASRTNAPRDGAHGTPIPNEITDFQQLD